MKALLTQLAPIAMVFATSCGMSELSAPRPMPPEAYEFELLSVDTDSGGVVRGSFRFRHMSNSRVRLWGFGFYDEHGVQVDDGSVFVPRYEIFRIKRHISDTWPRIPVTYCGTGAKQFSIQPDRDYTSLIPLWAFFTEEGTHGIVGLHGSRREVVSSPFETTKIQEVVAAHRSVNEEMRRRIGSANKTLQTDQPSAGR